MGTKTSSGQVRRKDFITGLHVNTRGLYINIEYGERDATILSYLWGASDKVNIGPCKGGDMLTLNLDAHTYTPTLLASAMIGPPFYSPLT